MRTLLDAGVLEHLEHRLAQLDASRRPRWGTMSAGSMVSHLLDCQAMAMSERKAEDVSNWAARNVMKHFALRLPMEWPKGIQTRPEFDPLLEGSKPGEFDAEKASLIRSLRRFAERPRDYEFGRHPMFHTLSEWEWMRWAWLHTDHHLRQFGL